MGTVNKLKIENLKLKIFVLHGWTYSRQKWDPFLSFLKSEGLNPYLLSIPGLTDKIDRPWDIDDYANWLYKKFENEKDKIILIGHSNGGRIALAFACSYPEKISKLILIDSAGIYHNEFSLRIKRAIFKAAAKIGKRLIDSKKAKDLLYFLAREKDYKNASPNVKKTMLNLLKSDKNLALGNIKAPTIIIWGRGDRITSLSDGKMLNQKIRNSKLFIIDNSSHSPQFTHPKEVVNIIAGQL
ncbi:MAG: hypothetical protein A3B44_00015 [Candidatus Levybacteria bacterium RIFCSPLOWO2_01_FULL_38_21]|nr:MAG: hypothetical protein A3B44_00015 [Candidatus Levybacteria bacterium RIFCSPLOWO2_01_FULL_38_21]